MWTWEYDDDITLNRKQLEAASAWFVGRLDELGLSNITYIGTGSKNFVIEYEWDDYCRGCHMGTHQESYAIPNDIFFSDQSLASWKHKEDQRQKEEERKKREKEERKRKKDQARLERREYERLRAKFQEKG